MGHDSLAPLARLVPEMDGVARLYILASPWRLDRLMGMSPRRLVPVYADRRNILLRPEG